MKRTSLCILLKRSSHYQNVNLTTRMHNITGLNKVTIKIMKLCHLFTVYLFIANKIVSVLFKYKVEYPV